MRCLSKDLTQNQLLLPYRKPQTIVDALLCFYLQLVA